MTFNFTIMVAVFMERTKVRRKEPRTYTMSSLNQQRKQEVGEKPRESCVNEAK